MDVVESYRSDQLHFGNVLSSGNVGACINELSRDILDVGEKEFQEFLCEKGWLILDEIGDEFCGYNKTPDIDLINHTIDEVYSRLEIELVSGPPDIIARE